MAPGTTSAATAPAAKGKKRVGFVRHQRENKFVPILRSGSRRRIGFSGGILRHTKAFGQFTEEICCDRLVDILTAAVTAMKHRNRSKLTEQDVLHGIDSCGIEFVSATVE